MNKIITLKGIIDEDFVNYKVPSMTLMFPYCNFKCEKECGQFICQNSALAHKENIKIDIYRLVKRYLENPISEAIVCQGLEPFDSFLELKYFINVLRIKYKCRDDVVIYTGYNKNEIKDFIQTLSQYENIIIKYGRFIPNQEKHYDEILGVYLASDNQYAEKVG